jgi:glycerol-3-phosphate dehydrogenase subunit B
MSESLHFDVVVIGAGTAGLTAGARLARAGARVCVLGKGIGSTHLAPATIDVLGYTTAPVTEWGPAIATLAPDHPYTRIGAATVSEAIGWFAETVQSGPMAGYRYSGDPQRNRLHPTALGALRPSALVPETMGAFDEARSAGELAIVGVPCLRDFHQDLCAANLRAGGVEARPLVVEPELERADMNALGLARHLDDEAWRAAFCAQLTPLLGDAAGVGLPAMLGLRDPHGVWMDLQHRLQRWVFEIPTLPPSVPGMRLYEILRAALRGAGGRLVLGAEVVGHERAGERIASVRTSAAGRELSYAADWFVLASGGLASGAIELDSHWVAHDRVLDLPLAGVPDAGSPRFSSTYLDEQPLALAGIAVDDRLCAHGASNVVVAGASLPGAVPWREGSGEGIALASGVHAATLIQDARGAHATAEVMA